MKQAEKGQQDFDVLKALAQANKPDQWTGGLGGRVMGNAAGATYTMSATTPATYITASAVT